MDREMKEIMFRLFYVLLMNIFRAPYVMTTMRYLIAHPEKFSLKKRYDYDRHLIRIMSRTCHVKTVCYGKDNLPKEGGYIMYPNHQGKFDALGIFTCHDSPCSVVIDKNKSRMVLVNEFIDLVEGKRLDRSDVRQAMSIIRDVAEDVKEGKRYVIFPEGGYEFNNKNEVTEFKPGSFKSATMAKAPIVPVALIDSYKVFNSFNFSPVTVQIHFLKPIPYEEYKGMKTAEIARLVKQQIEDTIAEYTF